MSQIYHRSPKIEESPLQGDLMLFDPVNSRFFVLNPTMAYLWRNCNGDKSIDKIIECVPNEFTDTDTDIIDKDMKAALVELVTLGLVTDQTDHL